ncbi:helix-turn-helix domain-containing protein [Paucilactobacillus suebicus]|uniref:winged helix-turn-helix transcriptional regulator n=1 Tax=Paucilactobacillus suebicus TaxID=152335 RepID=UPI00024905FD|nr:helix-turn-helix domain-containing protein [Paucilactobacillus suebicus]
MDNLYIADNTEFTCPVEATTSLIGRKWVPTILLTLDASPKRFGALKSEIADCSKKMLIQQLNLLLENNLVINIKTVDNNSTESTYMLSSMGQSLMPIVKSMRNWGNNNLACER